MQQTSQPKQQWDKRRVEKQRRLAQVQHLADGPVLRTGSIVQALEALIAPCDRVVLEGDNQKQADFLSRSLAKVDVAKVNNLHIIMPSVSRPEHLDLFELGIARKLDFHLPARKACASRSCCRTVCSKSAPSIPMSNCMRAFT
jgi:malonate decarboxylase alpha subunit